MLKRWTTKTSWGQGLVNVNERARNESFEDNSN